MNEGLRHPESGVRPLCCIWLGWRPRRRTREVDLISDQVVKVTGENGVTILIDELFCKGCTICVEVCPVDSLKMEPVGTRWQGSVAVVKDIEACIGCMLCELQCPDFAILVDKPEKKAKAAA